MTGRTVGEVLLPIPANLLCCLPCSAEFFGGLRAMDCMAWMRGMSVHSREFWQDHPLLEHLFLPPLKEPSCGVFEILLQAFAKGLETCCHAKLYAGLGVEIVLACGLASAGVWRDWVGTVGGVISLRVLAEGFERAVAALDA